MHKNERSLLEIIDHSFSKANGKLLPVAPNTQDRYLWLHTEAPYSILAHSSGINPHFIYVNDYALTCFKYTREEMLSLLSSHSTVEEGRNERQCLLEIVKREGIAYGYEGERVDKFGNSFTIYDGILWSLTNDMEEPCGQAALFWSKEGAYTQWYNKL